MSCKERTEAGVKQLQRERYDGKTKDMDAEKFSE
jgi:hypothetical protein